MFETGDDIQQATLTITPEGAVTDIAKQFLVSQGYVVHRAKSWRQLIERVRVAEALERAAEEHRESTQRWAQTDLHNDIRDLQSRCTFLYGVARARGATADELSGGWTPSGINMPLERSTSLQCQCGIKPYIIHDSQARPVITRFVCPEHGLGGYSKVEYSKELGGDAE